MRGKQFLAQQDRVAMTQIVAALYEFNDDGPRARRVLLEQAGLAQFVSGLNLSGPARTIAGDIMGMLEQFGPLSERQPTHALGMLLSYVLTLPELPRESAKVLAEMIVKYSLVPDPAYISKLRSDYAISTSIARASDTVATAPPRRPVPADEPAFTPKVHDDNQAEALERIINSEDNFLDIHLLTGALYCAQAVCRIEVPLDNPMGTGVLIGPDLLLTNQHVLKSKDYLAGSVARFDYYKPNGTGIAPPGRVFQIHPDFYFSSALEQLDYALVKLEKTPLQHLLPDSNSKEMSPIALLAKGKHRGFLVLSPRFIKEKERVNIIQHADGRPLQVVMTQNYVIADMSEARVQYVADTMHGSSGSPVFNQNWEIIALHHSGGPYPPDSLLDNLKKAWKGRFRVNEGIPMRAILKDFQAKGLLQYLPKS